MHSLAQKGAHWGSELGHPEATQTHCQMVRRYVRHRSVRQAQVWAAVEVEQDRLWQRLEL